MYRCSEEYSYYTPITIRVMLRDANPRKHTKETHQADPPPARRLTCKSSCYFAALLDPTVLCRLLWRLCFCWIICCGYNNAFRNDFQPGLRVRMTWLIIDPENGSWTVSGRQYLKSSGIDSRKQPSVFLVLEVI